MADTKLYDPGEVVVVFGAISLSGFAEGSFVEIERSKEAFALKVGADGMVTRIRSRDRSGEIKVKLKQTAPANLLLTAVAVSDEASPTGIGILPILVKDLLGNSIATAKEAWVKKMPKGEYGTDETEREWVFTCAVLVQAEGGN